MCSRVDKQKVHQRIGLQQECTFHGCSVYKAFTLQRDFTGRIQTHIWFCCRRVDLGEPLEFFLTVICDSLFDKVLIAQDSNYFSTGILADSFSKSSLAKAALRMNRGVPYWKPLSFEYWKQKLAIVESMEQEELGNKSIKGSSIPTCAEIQPNI